MSALMLDPLYNDLALVGGNLVLVPSNSVQEFAQELNARFAFGKGEWFRDLNQGFPWMQAVLGIKNPNTTVLATLFRQTIMSTPGAKAVTALPISFNASTRVLTWSATIQHLSGAYVVGGYGQPFTVQQQATSR